MKQFTTLLSLFSIIVILVGCGTKNLESAIKRGAVKVDKTALKQELTGSTVHASGYGQEADIIFQKHNKLSATNSNHEENTGKWTISEDGSLCMRFYQWGDKQTICYQVYDDNDTLLLFNKQGMQMYSFTITEKSTHSFNEGIHYKTSTKKSTPIPTASSHREIRPPAQLTVTPKTTKDVKFIIRQTAQNCPGCNLAKAQLSSLLLIGANLKGANLTGADLSYAILRRANLQGANLYKANLRGANLMGADLTGANLTEADLTDAKMKGAIGFIQMQK